MIPTQAIIGFICMILLGVLIPVAMAAVWKIKTKQPIWVILIGAAMFLGAVVILEQLAHTLILQTNNPLGRFIQSNVWATCIYGGLMAGLFEETARLIAFKFILKKRTERRTAISYGIGHGGFEVMYLLCTAGITNLVYAILINTGLFESVIVQPILQQAPEQLGAIEGLRDSLATYHFGLLGISLWERVGAVLIHISASILVFSAVRERKMWMYPLAILLHASIDFFAGMYQTGMIQNIYVFEAIISTWGVAMFAVCLLLVYKKLPVDRTE